MPVILPGDPDSTPKNNPPGGSPGGITPVSPGGGGAGAGGGSAFGTAPSGYGFTPNVGWRKLGMGGPYSTFKKGGDVRGPGGPKDDRIPAMLSAGEYVMPAKQASNPVVHALLEHLRSGGSINHAMLQRLCSGGDVKGYADGGTVGPDYSTHPADPWQDQGFAQAFGRLRGTPLGTGRGLAQAYNQYLHSPQGVQAYSPGGQQYQNGGPGMWGAYSGDPRQDINGAQNRIFGNAGAAGYFDPGGSKQVMESVRQNAQGNADALTRQAALSANVNGLDPGQAGAARLQALMGNQNNVANILAQAQYGQLQNQQQFLQNNAQNLFGNSQAAQQQQWMNNHQYHPSGAGAILGGLASGVGGAIGGGLTGFLGGAQPVSQGTQNLASSFNKWGI